MSNEEIKARADKLKDEITTLVGKFNSETGLTVVELRKYMVGSTTTFDIIVRL